MIKLIMDEDKLKVIYGTAEREGRTLLGVIYNDYIYPYTQDLETLNPKNVYANREFVLKLIELDKKLNSEGVDSIYLQYGPSINLEKPLKEDQLMMFLEKSCNN